LYIYENINDLQDNKHQQMAKVNYKHGPELFHCGLTILVGFELYDAVMQQTSSMFFANKIN
jgi:hypothetical protein